MLIANELSETITLLFFFGLKASDLPSKSPQIPAVTLAAPEGRGRRLLYARSFVHFINGLETRRTDADALPFLRHTLAESQRPSEALSNDNNKR